MEKRLVFVLAVAMVLVAIGGAVAEAATKFKAGKDASQWLVIQPFAADLSVSTQGALVTPCEVETCTASNTFLLLLLAINLAGNLFFDFDTSSPTSPGSFGCPPPTSGYSGEVFAPGVSAALVLEKVFQALDGCDFCDAYTKFTSGALPFVRNVGAFADACPS